jgi:HD-like signal output (HDOD) protein
MLAEPTSQPFPPLTPDDIVREVKHLPSTPKVLPRLKQLLSDANSSMVEIVALIRLDPGIAARVLQVGNSAYFSKGGRCITVDDAVNRVGYDQIYELVSFAAAAQLLSRPLAVYGTPAEELWKMAVVCALASEILADRIGEDRNAAYTTGLLHSLGMVVIDEWTVRSGRVLELPSMGFPRESTVREQAVFGFTQAAAGAALMKMWAFAPAMTEPVAWQYAPRGAGPHVKMASLLYVAKWLRSAVCTGTAPPVPEFSLLKPLELKPEDLKEIRGEVVVRLEEVSSLLEAAAVSG